MYSFVENKKIVDLSPYIRRLCDLTVPNLPNNFGGERSENRYNRTIPTLLTPWHDDQAMVDQSVIGLTSDLADRGISVALNQPFQTEHVVVGYWLAVEAMPEPWYFLGNIRRTQDIGGGFWKVGIQLAELMGTDFADSIASLKPWAAKLHPRGDGAEAPIPFLPISSSHGCSSLPIDANDS